MRRRAIIGKSKGGVGIPGIVKSAEDKTFLNLGILDGYMITTFPWDTTNNWNRYNGSVNTDTIPNSITISTINYRLVGCSTGGNIRIYRLESASGNCQVSTTYKITTNCGITFNTYTDCTLCLVEITGKYFMIRQGSNYLIYNNSSTPTLLHTRTSWVNMMNQQGTPSTSRTVFWYKEYIISIQSQGTAKVIERQKIDSNTISYPFSNGYYDYSKYPNVYFDIIGMKIYYSRSSDCAVYDIVANNSPVVTTHPYSDGSTWTLGGTNGNSAFVSGNNILNVYGSVWDGILNINGAGYNYGQMSTIQSLRGKKFYCSRIGSNYYGPYTTNTGYTDTFPKFSNNLLHTKSEIDTWKADMYSKYNSGGAGLAQMLGRHPESGTYYTIWQRYSGASTLSIRNESLVEISNRLNSLPAENISGARWVYYIDKWYLFVAFDTSGWYRIDVNTNTVLKMNIISSAGFIRDDCFESYSSQSYKKYDLSGNLLSSTPYTLGTSSALSFLNQFSTSKTYHILVSIDTGIPTMQVQIIKDGILTSSISAGSFAAQWKTMFLNYLFSLGFTEYNIVGTSFLDQTASKEMFGNTNVLQINVWHPGSLSTKVLYFCLPDIPSTDNSVDVILHTIL